MFLGNQLSALAAHWTGRGQYMVRCAGGAGTAICSLVAICAPGALLAAWLLLPSAMVMSTLTGVPLFAPEQALAATPNTASRVAAPKALPPIWHALDKSGPFQIGALPTCIGQALSERIEQSLAPCLEMLQQTQASWAQEPAARVLVRASVYIVHGKTDAARRIIAKAHQKFIASPVFLHFAARLALTDFAYRGMSGRYEDFSSLIKAALALAPNNTDFLATRAEGFFHRSQMGKAKTAYDRVLALNSDHVLALRRRAQINDILGRTDLMLGDLDRAVALAPDDQLLRAVRANARMKLKMFDGAIMDMTIVLRANPFDLLVRRQRAGAYYFSGKNLDALSDLNKLLEMFHGQPRFILSTSDRAALLLLRATILGKLARADEAADDVLLSIRLGGRRAILRMQVYLRAHGAPNLALSGKLSGDLRAAIRRCFSQNKCRQIASRNL